MKEISLTKGQYALVDDEDYDFLMQWKWNYNKCGYAVRSENYYKPCGTRTARTVLMHRSIVNIEKTLFIDHVNGIRFDNQKSNLRSCTHSQNLMNAKKHKGNKSSIYKGVSRTGRQKHWRAYIDINKKRFQLGWFNTEEEAAHAYNIKALEIFGDFSKLNEVKNA